MGLLGESQTRVQYDKLQAQFILLFNIFKTVITEVIVGYEALFKICPRKICYGIVKLFRLSFTIGDYIVTQYQIHSSTIRLTVYMSILL